MPTTLQFKTLQSRMGSGGSQLSCLVLCYFWISAPALSFIFPLSSLLERTSPRTLQSDHSCGLTTQGAEECWWSCSIVPARGLVITNPECFRDCFPPQHCVTGLLQDSGLHSMLMFEENQRGARNYPLGHFVPKTLWMPELDLYGIRELTCNF